MAPNRTIGEKLFALLALVLGVIASLLVGAVLVKLLNMAGLSNTYAWSRLIALGLAVLAGYRFYFWFLEWIFKVKKS